MNSGKPAALSEGKGRWAAFGLLRKSARVKILNAEQIREETEKEQPMKKFIKSAQSEEFTLKDYSRNPYRPERSGETKHDFARSD